MSIVTTRVAFLRAVNLGRRRVAMPRFRSVLEELGYNDVWTYVNSGNAVFDATGPRAEVERSIRQALESELNFEIKTFVRTSTEVTRLVAAKPFTLRPGDTHFVTFLTSTPAAGAKRALEALSNDFDTLVVSGRDVHWRMRGTSTASTLATKDWEAAIGRHTSTSRNMTMLRRLDAKIRAAVGGKAGAGG